jgi:hypothetical protein
MDKPFNADFYVTAATVIPVLFLALTLEGSFYKGLLDRIIAPGKPDSPEDSYQGPTDTMILVGAIAVFAAWCLLGMGFLGEFFAITALKDHYADAQTQALVYWFFIILSAFTVAGPAGSYARAVRDSWRGARERAQAIRKATEAREDQSSQDGPDNGQGPR